MADNAALTADEIAELERLRKAATRHLPLRTILPNDQHVIDAAGYDFALCLDGDYAEANAALIVAAVNALPRLLSTVKQQAARIQALEAEKTALLRRVGDLEGALRGLVAAEDEFNDATGIELDDLVSDAVKVARRVLSPEGREG